MSSTDDELRRLAEAAPDGEWFLDDNEGVSVAHDPEHDSTSGLTGTLPIWAHGAAAFIATANPQAVLALLDRVEAAEVRSSDLQVVNAALCEQIERESKRAEKAEAEVERLTSNDDPIPRYAQLDVWMALYGSGRSEEYGPFRDEHGFAGTWAFLCAEVRRLSAWKAEALPVMAGLQDLGHALGLPLGVGITGEQAAERAADLVAENAALRATVERVRGLADDGFGFGYSEPTRVLRAALDGDS